MQTPTDQTQGRGSTGCTAPHPIVPFLFFVVTLAAVVAAVIWVL